jgi:hypothetical protein
MEPQNISLGWVPEVREREGQNNHGSPGDGSLNESQRDNRRSGSYISRICCLPSEMAGNAVSLDHSRTETGLKFSRRPRESTVNSLIPIGGHLDL